MQREYLQTVTKTKPKDEDTRTAAGKQRPNQKYNDRERKPKKDRGTETARQRLNDYSEDCQSRK